MRGATLLLVPWFLVACNRETVGPNVEPTLGITDAPVMSGMVFRGDSMVAVVWSDLKTGLQITAGVEMSEYCRGIWNPDFVRFQMIAAGDARVIQRKAGPVRTSVWDFTTLDCTLFTTEVPLATGEASLSYENNDLYDRSTGSNTYGFSLHGQLTTSAGGTAIVSAQWWGQLQDGVFLRVLTSSVTFH